MARFIYDSYSTVYSICPSHWFCTGPSRSVQLKSVLKSSFFIKTIQARTPELVLEKRQHFRKLGIQNQSRVFWEVCLLSSHLNYPIWNLQFQWAEERSQKVSYLCSNKVYFSETRHKVLHAPPLPSRKRFVQCLFLKAQLHYFWKRRGRRLNFGASGKVIANKPSNCSVKI